MKQRVLALVPAVLLALTTGAAAQLESVRVASGLSHPTYVTHAPDDHGRLFIVEQYTGRIEILDLNTGLVSGTAFLDIGSRVIDTGNERGLLGLAFHPDYDQNGLFYVNYNNNSGTTIVAEYEVTVDPDVADFNSERIVMSIGQPQTNHNGGWIGFGPFDGYLYVATGDGGNFCDLGTGHTAGTGNAQDITSNLLGKMLRIDPVAVAGYVIPLSNPFVGVTGDDEIWSYGLRNPWRCSFDRLNGDLYIGDVGQDLREEVSYQPGASAGGENYGWRCEEGDACSSSSPSSCGATTGCNCPAGTPGLIAPMFAYSHQAPPAPAGFVCTVVGGYVYRGCGIQAVQGHYFLADHCGNAIWSYTVAGGVAGPLVNRTSELSPSQGGFSITSITSFGEDAAGEIYIVERGTGSNGEVFKIVSAGGIGVDCNANGVADACDIARGTSTDSNADGVPDECQMHKATKFKRP